MDIERTRYSIARYLRTRIIKIENSLEFITSSLEYLDRLSVAERDYANKLKRITDDHYEEMTKRMG